MIALDEWADMRRTLERAQAEYQQVQGRVRERVRQLRKDYGCSEKAARRKLRELKRLEIEAYDRWIAKKKRVRKKYPGLFGGT